LGRKIQIQLLAVVAAVLVFPAGASAYSVLSHEAVIDAAWDSGIRPLLLARFPNSTPDQLAEARSYAYGGSIIQDLGYYPFGSFFFTDLLHYVRSGDFIEAMLRDAQTEDEYAFALGAMAHYFSDMLGHTIAVNHSVPMRYPKLRHKYGNVVTFEEGKKQHILVEFAFDVGEVAGKAYAPQAYHDFIGFQIPKPLLERAFRETYGLEMNDVFINEDLAIGTYRHAVSKTIPHMTRVAWAQKHDQIKKLIPNVQRRTFIYAMARRKYDAEFGRVYRQPSFGERFLAFLLNLFPKVAFFRFLSFKTPTPQMEALFQQSFKASTEAYVTALMQARMGTLRLNEENLDTGSPTTPGEYALADQTYAQLLDKLAARHFSGVPAGVKADLLKFYSRRPSNVASKKEEKRQKKTEIELAELRAAPQPE
jgi:hypothetical protein